MRGSLNRWIPTPTWCAGGRGQVSGVRTLCLRLHFCSRAKHGMQALRGQRQALQAQEAMLFLCPSLSALSQEPLRWGK